MRTVKIKYNREWQEYQVELWIDGKKVPDATYHTDDKEDAEGTAAIMRK